MKHVVPAPGGGRIDVVLAAATGLGRRRIAAAFDAGVVRLNGRRTAKGTTVAPGDVIELDDAVLAAAGPPVAEPEVPLDVVFEDARVVALAKPAGVPSHPLHGELGTLAGALVARYPECARASHDPREGGLVHRLDVGTSGVIVAARDRPGWEAFRAAFGAGQTEKAYLALVDGALDGVRTVRGAIAQDRRDPSRVRVGEPDAPGRRALPAVTHVEPLERLGGRTLVRCLLATGRMHQVRAHLASLGHPLAGDAIYGGAPLDGLVGHFLHAERLRAPHPDGGALRVEAPLPADRAALLAALRTASPTAT